MHLPYSSSLRSKLIISFLLTLLPLLGMVAAILYSLYSHNLVVDHLLREVLEEKNPVMQIQHLVQQAIVPIANYPWDTKQNKRIEFEKLATQLDGLFDQCLEADLHQEQERKTLLAAHDDWRQIKISANKFFATTDPVTNNKFPRNNDDIFTHYFSMRDNLSLFQNTVNSEILSESKNIERLRQTIYLSIIVILTTGLALSVLCGLFLARSILHPISMLYYGARELAGGNLEHRIALNGNDEFGILIKTFNHMAERLRLNQEQLRGLATKDPLTGLINHREFFNILQNEIIRAKRYRRPFSVLMIDMDKFKEINDTKGHLVGDQVLRAVGALLREHSRKSDYICRYGGDEFSVLLTETEYLEAIDFTERLNAIIAEQQITLDNGEKILFSLSIGVASYPVDGANHLELMATADNNLYRVKKEKKKQPGGKSGSC